MKLFHAIVVIAVVATAATPSPRVSNEQMEQTMELGAFSVSLSVKDLEASREFYEKLGFTQLGGDTAQNYLILQNGTTTIGLFHGMFEGNILTFNPGWDHTASALERFQDVRDIQQELKNQGVEFQSEADESTDGPASMILVDPDGNSIFLDQHVPRPKP